MSFNLSSSSPNSHHEAVRIRDIGETLENIEQTRHEKTKKLLGEAVMFLSKSRLFGNNPDTAERIKQHLIRAKESNNTRVLEYIIEKLKNEKGFILEYARLLASESADNLPLYEFQNNLSMAYIQYMIHAPESRDAVDSETSLKQAQIAYNLV